MLKSLQATLPSAVLVLADGSTFVGESMGAAGTTAGEVVFSTAMTGYQEILTDPSYRRQLVTFTYPHIGNAGVNPADAESGRIQAAGLIVRDLARRYSNFRGEESLHDYLQAAGTVGIAGIDTRQLTRLLRDGGAQNGAILALAAGEELTQAHLDEALAVARAVPAVDGLDLVRDVTTDKPYDWNQAASLPGQGEALPNQPRLHVVVYDLGVRRSLLAMLAEHGCQVTVVPAQTAAADVLKLQPDGVLFSSGPGDPAACDDVVAAARDILVSDTPVFGTGLGHQVMALALGARTVRLTSSHHGANHPVRNLDNNRVSITRQSHSFVVDSDSLPETLRVTHRSLFDDTLQGLEVKGRPAFSYQGQLSASLSVQDAGQLLPRFVSLMEHRAD